MTWERGEAIIIVLLLIVLGVSVYKHYETELDLQRLCELTGPHDVSVIPPPSATQEIDNICLQYQSD